MKTEETTEQPAAGQVMPVVHTPGPWMHELELDRTGQESLEVMEVNGHQMRIVSWGKSCITQTDIANALLIAAAPELLEALTAMVVMMDRGGEPRKFDDNLTWRENDEKARKMAADAIAKATGLVV